jgi:ribonuclease P protein component
MSGTPRPFRFPRASRLQHKREFDAVYAGKARVEKGPLVANAIPAVGGRSRLGLSIGRRMGGAVRRSRFKRLLREAFRHEQATFLSAYDVVLSLRPHEELPLETYRSLLSEALTALDHLWTKRRQRNRNGQPASPTTPAAPADVDTPRQQAPGPSGSSPEC